jgi:HAD superfamily hydrolase (TIGR01509 family)
MTGVIFDLDGVIVETEQLWERSWVAAASRRGYAWTADDTSNAQGMSLPEWSAYLARRSGAPDEAERIGTECVDEVVAAVRAGEGPLLDGARKLVVDVSALVPVALASSAARRVIDAVLDHNALADRFVATVSSEEVPRGKPSPDVYLEAARRVGLADGNGSGIAVEDSTNGIKAAHAAGLHVVALPNRAYPPRPESIALAEYVASDHDDARTYIVRRIELTRGSGL